MKKLNDLQSILLATAAGRDSGSLYPVADSAAAAGARVARAINALTKAGLSEEREAGDAASTYRADGDLRFGLFITAAGCEAIGVGEAAGGEQTAPAAGEPPARTSKAAAVVILLQRDNGATLPELIAATGWLPHTTRAALTGLRKKGHSVERSKRDGSTCYRIVAAG